jgi:hypothetical protein
MLPLKFPTHLAWPPADRARLKPDLQSAICICRLQSSPRRRLARFIPVFFAVPAPGKLLLDEGARLNLMLNQYKVGGKGDDAMQYFQIPYGETRQIRRKGDGSGGSSKKRKRGAAVSQGDEGLPPDDGEAEGGGKSAGDGEEIAASFAV